MSDQPKPNENEPALEDASRNTIQDPGHEESEVAPTPFDHPLFLPVVCIGFTVWFGYDTFIHPMEEHLDFNFYGFKAVLGAAVWYGYQGWAEIKEQPVMPWVLPTIFAFLAAWLGAEAFGVPGFELGELIEYPQLSLYGFYLCAALTPLSALRERMRVKRAAKARSSAQA